MFLFSCVFKQIFQARQWQFRSRWGKTGLDLQDNHSSLVFFWIFSKSQQSNNLTESDNFGCTKLRCWQLRALPQHAHDLKGLKAMQGYALPKSSDSGNPWQSMAIPKLPSDTNKCEQFTQAPSLACQSSEFRNLQGHSGYASKLSEKNLKAGTSSFLMNFCMMFSSTWKLQSFPLNAWKSCRESNENRENSLFQKTDLCLVLVAPPKVPWPKPHQIEVGATAEPGRETQMERLGVSADSGFCSIIYIIYTIYAQYLEVVLT